MEAELLVSVEVPLLSVLALLPQEAREPTAMVTANSEASRRLLFLMFIICTSP